MTAKIISTFPKENASTYFVSPIKKRDSLNGRPSYARGKLVDKVKNILYKSGERKRQNPSTANQCPAKKRKISEEAKGFNTTYHCFLKYSVDFQQFYSYKFVAYV